MIARHRIFNTVWSDIVVLVVAVQFINASGGLQRALKNGASYNVCVRTFFFCFFDFVSLVPYRRRCFQHIWNSIYVCSRMFFVLLLNNPTHMREK